MKNKCYFSIALLLWLTITMISCSKEKVIDTKVTTTEPIAQLYAIENYSVQNGLLVFAHYNDVNALVKELQNLEKDVAYRNTAYENIGITTAIRNGEVNYTDHPICQQFEQEKGYTSQRNFEEANLFSELESGNENINSIIGRPYLKSILNQDGAVKVGSRIFKIYDSGLTSIIANSDWQKYDEIKDLPEAEIRESYNLRLTTKAKDDLDFFYTMDADNTVLDQKPVKDLRIRQTLTADGQIEVANNSFIESASGNPILFEWEYPDGTRSIGIIPNQSFAPGDDIKVRTTWPGDDWGDDPWWTSQAESRSCAIPDFKVTPLGNRTFRFDLENEPIILQENSSYYLNWDFGDGSSATGFPVTHTYAASVGDFAIVTCSARRGNGSVLCQFGKSVEIEPECTLRNVKKDDQEFDDIDGEKWRIDCKIWIDNSVFTTGDVGSGTKSLKHNGMAFFGKKTEQVWISLEGVHFNRINGNCILHERPFEEESETDSGNVQRNLTDDNDPRIYPNQLWSTHKIKVNGHILRYDKNGGKLYLN